MHSLFQRHLSPRPRTGAMSEAGGHTIRKLSTEGLCLSPALSLAARLLGCAIFTAALFGITAPARAEIPACNPFDRQPYQTCVDDGTSGWQVGLQWRLAGFEAPHIDAQLAGCRAEQIQGIRARDRLRQLMAGGYTITDTARRDRQRVRLVKLILRDGRNAGIELLSAGLIQAVPNNGNRWCER